MDWLHIIGLIILMYATALLFHELGTQRRKQQRRRPRRYTTRYSSTRRPAARPRRKKQWR